MSLDLDFFKYISWSKPCIFVHSLTCSLHLLIASESIFIFDRFISFMSASNDSLTSPTIGISALIILEIDAGSTSI